MNKRIIKNFFKDNLGFTLSFFINSIIIGVFYYLSTGSSVEILYPALLSFFIYSVSIAARWFKYYPFNSSLEKSLDDVYHELEPSTCEQRETGILISSLHQSYMEKMNNIQLENLQARYFISQWIHNMKTPVSIIDLVVQKFNSGETDSGEAIKDIKLENERLLSNLEQVLSIIRLDEFSRDYVPESIDLAASLRKVINSKKSQFIYNKVFPKFESQEEVPVLSDAKWNEVMLEQLVSNAIKYSGDGISQKYVYFSIEKKDGLVLLKIKDEGIGIPEYDIKRVFEPFFTGENGRKFKNSTGIGLYICSIIAGKLGHKIQLESTPGLGTEVTISYLSKL